MNLRFFALFTILTFLVPATIAEAAVISASVTAPTVDGYDIANLSLGTSFVDFGSSFMWPDRPARGQTFTTGSFATILDSFTVQADRDAMETSSFNIRISSIAGSMITPLVTETGSLTSDISANDYVTFALDTPVVLLPNTQYSFDVALFGSDGGFSSHGWGFLNNSQTEYLGGTAFNSGSNGAGGGTLNALNQDRIFQLNLVPEPASIAVWGIIGLGTFAVRRYRRKK